MCPVLHFDPVLRASRLIGAVAAFRHQAFQPHVAGGAEQVGTDLAPFERRDKDAVRPAMAGSAAPRSHSPLAQTRLSRLPCSGHDGPYAGDAEQPANGTGCRARCVLTKPSRDPDAASIAHTQCGPEAPREAFVYQV
jgi:hypothetical protein